MSPANRNHVRRAPAQ